MYYSYCLAYGIGPKGRINTEGIHCNVHVCTAAVYALLSMCDTMEHNYYIFNHHHPLIFL